MKKIFALLMAVTGLVAFVPSSAYSFSGEIYVGAFGAGNWISADKWRCSKQSYDGGYAVTGFAGYRWCEGWRIEGEFGYRRNILHRFKFDFGSSCDSCFQPFYESYLCKKPALKQWSGMVNVLYEMDPCAWNCFSCCIPYCGVGLGVANQKIRFNEIFEYDFDYGYCPENLKFSRDETGFAWQVMIGIAYRLTTHIDVSVEYRMLQGPIEKLYNHGLGVTTKYLF